MAIVKSEFLDNFKHIVIGRVVINQNKIELPIVLMIEKLPPDDRNIRRTNVLYPDQLVGSSLNTGKSSVISYHFAM